jgi:hypothetical protein
MSLARQENKNSSGVKMNTWSSRARIGALSVVAAAALGGTTAAMGAELEYRASLGAGYTDNVRRRPTDQENENIGIAGLSFSLDEQSRRMNADVVGDLAYYEYLNDSYDSELLGNVYADVSFALVPERFIWVVGDQFGQVLSDPFLPATGDNRENINYASTGPDLIFGLGSQMRLRISGRYSLTTYEEEPLDSTTVSGEMGLVRILSDRSSISLNGRAQQIEYDESTLNADFDQQELFLRYEAAGARTNLTIDAGYGELEREISTEVEGGPLLQLDMSRRLSDSSLISLVGGHRFATSAGAFASDQGITDVGLDTAPGRQTAEPFILDEATASWAFARNRTGLNLSGNWSQRTYEDNPSLDQTMITMATRFTRDMTPMQTLELSASYTTVQYEPPAFDYHDLTASASFIWRLTRSLTLEAKYEYYDRNSDAAELTTTENRLLLSIGWGRGEPRATRSQPRFGIDPPAPVP